MKDYIVEIKIKNGWFLKRMRAAGFSTVLEFAKSIRMSSSSVGLYVNLKKAAVDKKGKWREQVHKIANGLRCLPEDLFPPQHVEQALRTNKIQMELSAGDVTTLIAQSEKPTTPEQQLLLKEVYATVWENILRLSPQDRKVICMRLGFDDDGEKTLDETAKIVGVSRTRISTIEAKVLRKLRNKEMLEAFNVLVGNGRAKLRSKRQEEDLQERLKNWYDIYFEPEEPEDTEPAAEPADTLVIHDGK